MCPTSGVLDLRIILFNAQIEKKARHCEEETEATTRQSPDYSSYVLKASRQQGIFCQVREIAGQQSRLQRGFAGAGAQS